MELAESYGATVQGIDTLEETIQLLTAGRIDATLNADVSFYDYLNVHPDADFKLVALRRRRLPTLPSLCAKATRPPPCWRPSTTPLRSCVPMALSPSWVRNTSARIFLPRTDFLILTAQKAAAFAAAFFAR